MCKVIAVSGLKGGISKTTSSMNIGIGLARAGKKVMLLDIDPQGDLTKSLGIAEPEKIDYTLTKALVAVVNEDDVEADKGILHHDEGVDFIPANSSLASLEKELGNTPGGDTVLRDYVDLLRERYEYIIIDSKPAMVTLSVNVLAAADIVLIPVLSEYLPVTDIEATVMSIRLVQRRINKKLKIGGIFLTMVDDRTNLAKEVENQIKDAYVGNVRIFDTKIPRSVRVAEAPVLGESIYKYDPKGKATKAYAALTREVLEICGNGGEAV
ncbi:MAG: ParA family protein [Lachnospiraceae bacterium]|nr:ParA family protein [Lachnospiraceae bacterium]